MKLSASERLRRFYDQFSSNDHVLVVIDADPDAISSAMAIKRLLWRKVAGTTISNINTIKRPDNIAMIRLLGANLVYIDEIDVKLFNRFVVVDSQPDHHEVFTRLKPDVIIDHHPETGSAVAPFLDIRPKYGATASIMTEYLKAAGIKPSAKLATGLFYAIKTDTDNFKRKASVEDIRAFQLLFRHVNINLVQKIEQAELKPDFLKHFQSAIQEMCMYEGRVFAHLGQVENLDVCVLIADFFMKIDSVNWSIVSGIYAENLILVFRNDGLRKDAGKIAKLSFDHIGSAGGHKSMSRAEIPVAGLNGLVDYKDDRKLLDWIIERVERHIRKNNAK